jgi:CRISPR-associated endonuclease/helicase Cas3
MMVTFVAQCEKKALNKTRRVLDAFANRIGSRTWQTIITHEGLQAVKKLLRKTASKNTAVSCHWSRSRSRNELVWIVGNRNKFNNEGFVPVNTTQQTIMNTQWEDDWHYLPLIKSLAALAGLFHDWGKASELFQEKLNPQSKNTYKGDPLRHEWISSLFLNGYVNGAETDEEWLTRLAGGEISASDLKNRIIHSHQQLKDKNKPLAGLPKAASILAWLVLSHHRLPLALNEDHEKFRGDEVQSFNVLFNEVTQKWGYESKFDDFEDRVSLCFSYPKSLPCESQKWLRYAKRSAEKLLTCLNLLEQSILDGSWRLILHHARLSLMLGDHYHSSQDADAKWNDELGLYANTDRATKELKQTLGEHLVGVAKQAARNAHLLPAFEGKHAELQRAFDVKVLRRKSPVKYHWQDKAVAKINIWRAQQDQKLDDTHFGFFSVNMASTGKGKTFANAKIMRALSVDRESLRYILALGLRTLTLQTGDEYRERIGLNEDELAILIGSRAVLDLHNQKKQEPEAGDAYVLGSESEQDLLENELIFNSDIPEKDLATVLPDKKSRQFLYAPVLSCTIDHLMGATETKRGGRYILPALRLMSSDLVIDEIDDFDGTDLIAIGRLIHLAGMLGRKVMISSATIPPDLAEGYFNVYQAGWLIFSKMRNRSPFIGCCWVDEFTTIVQNVNSASSSPLAEFKQYHHIFTQKRLDKLDKEIPKRRANICVCDQLENKDEEAIRSHFYSVIQAAILEKHLQHHNVDKKTDKLVSFGVVRVANIKPCVELTRYLLNATMPADVEIRTMAYHSQQLLIMRNEQEKHLDAVLKRHCGEQSSFDQKEIREHLDTISKKHVIFILVATPVEEVGRDHDFDWAVVEPSSYRSFIQLAGRVRRHREAEGSIEPNIALLQYNLNGLIRPGKPVFCHPGYESRENLLDTHDLMELVDGQKLAERLDAKPRIARGAAHNPRTNLADLEHEVIHQLLTSYDQQGPEAMQGWVTGCWWLTALPQLFVRFRAGSPQIIVYLIPEGTDWKFVEKVDYGETRPVETIYGIIKDEKLTKMESDRLWLHRDYEALLEKTDRASLKSAALIYGEIGLPTYGKDNNDLSFAYSDQLGLVQN